MAGRGKEGKVKLWKYKVNYVDRQSFGVGICTEMLNKLGEEGWELVFVDRDQTTGSGLLFLKREAGEKVIPRARVSHGKSPGSR